MSTDESRRNYLVDLLKHDGSSPCKVQILTRSKNIGERTNARYEGVVRRQYRAEQVGARQIAEAMSMAYWPILSTQGGRQSLTKDRSLCE